MDVKEANQITIERIRVYMDLKAEKLPDRSKFQVLNKFGFKAVEENYEAYVKVSIPKNIYKSAKDGAELKTSILAQIAEVLR